MSADLRLRRSPESSWEIQCAVNAKYDDLFELDQASEVKLIRPQDFY